MLDKVVLLGRWHTATDTGFRGYSVQGRVCKVCVGHGVVNGVVNNGETLH